MELVTMTTVENEIEKNRELKKSDLDILRDWHKKQPHLPPISDYELMLFLHGDYYRTEAAKTTIDGFFTFKTHIPEFFSKRDPVGSKELREMIKVVCCFPLPSTTPEGYKVLFLKLMDCEPSHYMFADSLKLIFMSMELAVFTEGLFPGYIVVVDIDGTRLGHLSRLNPMTMKKLIHFVQEAIPIRLKGIHFMNSVPFIDMFLNIAKPFMKKELMDILFFHSTSSTLKKMVPIDILPNEQGGKAGPFEDLWAVHVKVIENHREWFEKDETTRRVNEALRSDKVKRATDIFGVEGSFKKLDID